MNMQSKYRPYFSSAELQEIIRCVKSSSTNITLIRYLESFALKISHDTISPQLTIKPSPTLEQKLGLVDSTSDPYANNNQSAFPEPAESIHSLYRRWSTDPASLKPAELQRVHQYRYENDLMSAEEESKYEASLMFGGSFQGK